ncbi:MAG: hypoxanthine phosphoribosyltransferase [Chloroflexi bacterium]|nr:MAG: hypoxanthine phosphoribosyltransferase [Chloroflexota bacterium]
MLGAAQIRARVRRLARQIDEDYRDLDDPLSVIVVLKGACFFAVDLLRCLKIPTRLDFLQASSYKGVNSTGEVRLHKDISMPIAGARVLLVEDIVDTGVTARWLIRHLESHSPKDVKLCALLDKPSRRLTPVTLDYTGFTVADVFAIGYGLDFQESHRSLPSIYEAVVETQQQD